MNVLAEKSMGDTVTATRSALLNAILATSTFHRQVSRDGYWQVTAECYQEQARQDLLHGFQREVGSAQKWVKYKEGIAHGTCQSGDIIGTFPTISHAQ